MDRNIIYLLTASASRIVALRKESVDRNTIISQTVSEIIVALRKESVDRNLFPELFKATTLNVALRKESVDRNDKSKKSKMEK